MRRSSGCAWRSCARRAYASAVLPGRLTGRQGCELEVGAAQIRELTAWLEARRLGAAPLLLVQIGNKRTLRRGLRRLAVNHKYWPMDAGLRCSVTCAAGSPDTRSCCSAPDRSSR